MEAVLTSWSHDGMIARRNEGDFTILDDFTMQQSDFAMPHSTLQNFRIRSCLCPNFAVPPKRFAKFSKVTKIEILIKIFEL